GLLSLLSAEQQRPVRRPRLRRVSDARLRLADPFGGARAVGALAEDREVPVAIGLERDPLSVPRPDGRAVVPAECEALRRAATGQLVRPDARLLFVEALEGDPLSI